MIVDVKADITNWMQAPHNRWAFTHCDELLAGETIAHDPASALSYADNPGDLKQLQFRDGDDNLIDVETMLAQTETDGFLVARGGEILLEEYRNGHDREKRHILFSTSKSITGMVVGILVARGLLQPEALITDYIPELATSVYGDAKVRDLLDMTVGLVFDEDYLATDGVMQRYRQATGWFPLPPGDTTTGMNAFFTTLKERSGPHGEVFAYVSTNSDVLGWLIERVTDRSFAELFATEVWQPMGAASDAFICTDPKGAPRTAGGICCTLRDFARFGRLIVEDGKANGQQIIPKDWIADTRQNGSAQAWRAGGFAEYFTEWDFRYRNQWYVMNADPLSPFIALGIYGQLLFIDPANNIVIARQSSTSLPLDVPKDMLALYGCLAISKELA
jgi:CubicO group peptidase (beta-lactamase class C family)